MNVLAFVTIMMKPNGNTFLEILVAMALFSLVVLSLTHLQFISSYHLQKAYEMIQATQFADKDEAPKRVHTY